MIIDNSQLSSYINCPRYYRNCFILKLKKVRYDERDIARDWGSCIHSALAILHKEKDLNKAKQIFRDQYIGIETEKAKTPAHGEILIERYFNYWQSDNHDLSDKKFEVLEVEKQVTFEIVPDITWLVKLDTIIKNNAGIWSLEHKSTSHIAYNFFFQFDPNMQISGQCEAIRQKYGQCSGAIIDALCCGYRERAYKGEPAGFWCEFQRDITNRNKEQLDDFKLNVIAWVKRLNDSLLTNDFPKNESFCHQYKGCRYRELCQSVDDSNVIDTCYEQFDPYEYLKEE